MRAGDLSGKLASKLLHISKEEITEAHSRGIECPVQGRNENAKDSVKVEEIACEHFKPLLITFLKHHFKHLQPGKAGEIRLIGIPFLLFSYYI